MGCVSRKWVQFHPSCHSLGKEKGRQDLKKKKFTEEVKDADDNCKDLGGGRIFN